MAALSLLVGVPVAIEEMIKDERLDL